MNGEKLNPRVDIVFKKIFGVDENKDLLISLINSIIDESDQIKDLTIKNPYNNKNFKEDKLSVLDIKAKAVNGKIFNIEMQITDQADYDKRALYYWAKSYTEQMSSAQSFAKLQKTFGIHILNFLSIPESPKYHNVFKLKEKDIDIKKFEDIELHTIELSKFDKNLDSDLPKILEKKNKIRQVGNFFPSSRNFVYRRNSRVSKRQRFEKSRSYSGVYVFFKRRKADVRKSNEMVFNRRSRSR